MRSPRTAVALWLVVGCALSAGADPPPGMKLVTKGSHQPVVSYSFGIGIDARGNPVEDVYQPDRSTALTFRFRNRSGKAYGWTDHDGEAAPRSVQAHLQRIAEKMGDRYQRGDWIEVTCEQIGWDERQNLPQIEPNRDGYIGVLAADSTSAQDVSPQPLPLSPRDRGAVTAPDNASPVRGEEITTTDQPLPTGILLEGSRVENRGGARAIKGTFRNASGASIGRLTVFVNLYDEAGALVENTSKAVNDLGNGQTWAFRISMPAGATSFRIVRVTTGR